VAGHHRLAEFAVPPMPDITVLELELLVYVRAALVQRQHILLSTDPETGCLAEVTFRLVRTFDHLPDLTDRKISIAEGHDHLTINGVRTGAFTFTLADAQWNRSALDMRTELTNIHFRKTILRKYRPRYAFGTTSQDQFQSALLQLARSGHALLNGLFLTSQARGLGPMLRLEAMGRAQPPVVEIARTGQRPFVLPWQMLYDLPLNPRRNITVCDSVREYGPLHKGDDRQPPVRCPHEDKHPPPDDPATSTLCPWGFWGLAYLIEVPEPPQDRNMDEFVTDTAASPQVVSAAGAGLDAKQLATHLKDMHHEVDGFPNKHLTKADALMSALANPADIVYVLCHNENGNQPGGGSVLMFADGPLGSDEVAEYTRTRWPKDHWREQHRPLIVLNACRTAEIVQTTMSGFVKNFTGAGAAGVVGTETMIDQPTASRAMQHFLGAFAKGATVSEALRIARWKLLAQGSLMGLTYSPYCSATLRLRSN
jgi:hypothetical protein